MTPRERAQNQLEFIYGRELANAIWPQLASRLDDFRTSYPRRQAARRSLTEQDILLITYGDQIRQPGRPPLRTLAHFLDSELAGAVSGVHILPCFPYSSDDGFSIIDFLQIDPELGSWADIEHLSQGYRLMFDAVVNHVSQHSAWFEGFRQDRAPYSDYFITVAPDADLSQVVRPRTLPLLTTVATAGGRKQVWTTFSEDQIDLNYANPAVLLEMTGVLLHYVAHGAEIIRLDAIAYLWKEMATRCIHLPRTHAVVKLWRALLDEVAPGVLLITETNVPHAENTSYFGEPLPHGTDEAQMVYNFSLAPLTLHAFLTGDASKLSAWAGALASPAQGAAFFNFIASHDGIGIRPAEGILTPDEIQALVERTMAHGGQASFKANPDGSRSVYELNTTLFDFLNDPAHRTEQDNARFLASQAILLSLAGVPGIYVHSLFGSRNCQACLAETGRSRSLNRRKFTLSGLYETLSDPNRHERRVFDAMRRLLVVRRQHPAFHPAGEQRVLDLGSSIFALLRTAPDGSETVLCLTNVTAGRVRIGRAPKIDREWADLLGEGRYRGQDITLAPYQTLWLRPALA